MKARILDADALRAIAPVALAAYARAEGWKKAEPYGAHADVYVSSDRPELVLPRTERLGDYAAVVSRLITVFAETSGRDELSVYKDLIGADRDVIRVRSTGVDDDGSLPIDAGVELVTHARDMLLAAACAVRSPRALYRAGANREANEYLNRVRLGQTEHGSFVVTLLSPVPPALQPALFDPVPEPLDEEPMERAVTRRLIEALNAMRSATERAASGDGRGFDEGVSKGVSANLCEAVAGLVDRAKTVDISITWARTRPAPTAPTPRLSFTQNDSSILKEAARNFRSREPRTDVKLFGFVHALRRERDDAEGTAKLRTFFDDRPQTVSVKLDQTAYRHMVDQHRENRPVLVTGDLEKVGRSWLMLRPTLMELEVTDIDSSASDAQASEPHPTPFDKPLSR